MARYLANLTNGQIDEKGLFRLFGVLLNQSGVLQSGAFQVAAQGTPDMTVKVPGAVIGHDIVFINTDGATYHGWNTADENVTISANASGVTKTDAIVAYANLTDGIATSNNPGGLDLVAVRRSGSNTGAPTSGEISTAVASNPYVVLAHVTVNNGASSINSGNISDQRRLAQLKVPVKRQNNITNSDTSAVILSGWGFILGDATIIIEETVTFGTTFASAPVVTATPLNARVGSDPTTIADLTAASEDNTCTARSITTTGFTVAMQKLTGTFGNTARFGYSWIAIGEPA
jgi:hypothetical protein